MPYRPLDLPLDDHRKIRNLPDVTKACEKIADELRAKAAAKANAHTPGAGDGYVTETRHGRDRVRVYVRAEGDAVGVENAVAPLMQVSAELGPR
ncbi:hypothetical protein SEA_LILPHARAOH_12 [Mycobacterium phage LilPharaoh]|uniref:Uncharacterized protein n=1 Tax=Mycobacterium phage Amelie TaxID=1913035 RepID=A0A1J0GPX7_9CAUD|nr:neck protein [Mycobacterium phage Enkosi]YP_009952530.1 neck protein [Mycobacterium phage Amelie]ATN90465.1 hypothetical protein SEA_LILPHARAOH_12 [Mycobacterium phage LilPharaoh]AVP42589.1 hypothetical protein SEA_SGTBEANSPROUT_12 [Mycobacterium phage SgtBeansprout]AXC37118.1 hypothetical protein SEA_BIGLEBOPS_12 [Mycobacterium phage Biglebops]QGJ93297.1 hypothetical protein PBI_MDAVU_12 [Mycobacterium phage Mdavu]UQS94413.1 hypothetical protein SEA_NUTELLO_12 [Mycobacterium phage Nutello